MRTDFETLDVHVDGDIVEIALNRPAERNAINHLMHQEIIEAFEAAAGEDGLRAIVFASNGRVFSAGGDFDLILADRARPERRAAMAAEARQIFTVVTQAPLPIVAALQGDVVGLGATLALGCDAIVAARTARISDPHVAIGLVAGDGGCVLWPQAIGLLRAKRYLLTGDRLSAETAHAIGLITDLVETPDEVRPTAHGLARRIAALPPLAVQLTKRALNEGLRQRSAEVFERALEFELNTFFSDDVGEAIAAIRGHRTPVYHGC